MNHHIHEINREWVVEEYCLKNRTLKSLADEKGCSITTIRRFLQKFNIKSNESKIIIPKKDLHDMYVVQKLNSQQIATLFNCSLPTVTRNLRENNIKLRTPSERKKGHLNPMFGLIGKKNPLYGKTRPKDVVEKCAKNLPRGPKHFRYKPPEDRIEKLNAQIRNCCKSKKWKKLVYERDGGRCVECSSLKNIHIDHIIPFSVLKNVFNIASLEDAVNCKELWDTNNGRVLCQECHQKTPTWGQGAKNIGQKI